MLKLKTRMTLPAVGLTGFEAPLGEEEAAIQGVVQQFAKNVLRPIGQELDRMSALRNSSTCARSAWAASWHPSQWTSFAPCRAARWARY
jgi:hypothetical protein